MSGDDLYAAEWERQRQRPDVPAGHLPVHRWYLSMVPVQRENPPSDIEMRRAERPSVAFYRFLYNCVGKDWLWGDKRRVADADIADQITRDNVHVMVAYRGGTPVGFYELDLPKEGPALLNYFGLLPGETGDGRGPWMLDQAIDQAARHGADTLLVDTCTLDHPGALKIYRRAGFEIIRELDFFYPDPRLDGTIRRDAAPHVPLAVSDSA